MESSKLKDFETTKCEKPNVFEVFCSTWSFQILAATSNVYVPSRKMPSWVEDAIVVVSCYQTSKQRHQITQQNVLLNQVKTTLGGKCFLRIKRSLRRHNIFFQLLGGRCRHWRSPQRLIKDPTQLADNVTGLHGRKFVQVRGRRQRCRCLDPQQKAHPGRQETLLCKKMPSYEGMGPDATKELPPSSARHHEQVCKPVNFTKPTKSNERLEKLDSNFHCKYILPAVPGNNLKTLPNGRQRFCSVWPLNPRTTLPGSSTEDTSRPMKGVSAGDDLTPLPE